jgi:Na+-translocating ferredoxin:NAD+ oxidoreductase RNF subunit RnfB
MSAIKGEKRQVHVIDETLCTRCGACAKACRLDAIALAEAGFASQGQSAGRSGNPSRVSMTKEGA